MIFLSLASSNPDVTHLCTIPESYDMVQKEIHLSLMPITENKNAEYILKERAFIYYRKLFI